MTTWSGGYVADIDYMPGYYRQQAAPHMRLGALLGGVDARLPGAGEAAHYLELGCGQGLNALLTAASNPGWRVTAIDYNPAHIAYARRLAHEAGLQNVSFLEADVTAPWPTTLPAADVVSLHGVWSWVSPTVRQGLVRLLAAAVAPGGIVHVSYNCLPSWQGALGMQRLVFEAGRRGGGRSDRQVTSGLAVARSLLAAKARFLHEGTLPAKLLEYAETASVAYLAHEYMNDHWSPCFHADVAGALAEAKLDWVGSCNLLEAFPDLNLSTEQRAVLDQFDDPIMRELVKDTCMSRHLRHDLFVRGARRLNDAARDAALRELTLMLTVPVADFDYKPEVPAGTAELGAAFPPMVAALGQGPATVGELLSVVPGRSNPAELAATLVGSSQAMLLAHPHAEAGEGTQRLNRVLGRQVTSIVGPENSGGLASPRLGAALPLSRLSRFVAGRLLERPGIELESWFRDLSHDVPEDKHAELRTLLASVVERQVPMLRVAGVLPG